MRARRKSKYNPYDKHMIMQEFSNRLNENLPMSEKWFHGIYRPQFEAKHPLELYQDKYNYSFNDVYIPDVINIGYKYVIEVDGKIHDKEVIKLRDERKTEYFEQRGYTVIRVKYPDLEKSIEALQTVLEIRKDPKHPKPDSVKVKLNYNADDDWS